MRAHDFGATPATHRRQDPVRRPAAPSPTPLLARPGSRGLSPAAISALQRTVGNAAVAAMLRRARRERSGAVEEPPISPAPMEQPSTVHQVLSTAGTPLGEPLREEMEARLGADFHDVRIHTGGAAQRSAAEIGARAYTSGTHVVIGRDGADRHTLAHELTHVIQQREGPVSGSDHGQGLRISDPDDRFEREAEATARHALAQPMPRPDLPRRRPDILAAVPAVPGVQRAPSTTRPQVNHPGGPWQAINDAGRADGGLVLSGHGSWDAATPDFKVPKGTKVHLYCQHGNTVLDEIGGLIETGVPVEPASIRTGRNTIIDYTLHPPNDLDVHGTPVAVTQNAAGYVVQLDPTQPAAVQVASLRDPILANRTITFTHNIRLSAILQPNMGEVHMAACRHYDIPAFHDRTRNQS